LYKKLNISVIILVFTVLAFPVKAQQFNFHPLSIQLPAECYQVLQDSKGYLWFSTDKGLYKYNGNTLKRFSIANGMPDNAIFKLYEDTKGHLFFTSLPGVVGYISNDSIVIPKFNTQLLKFLNHGRDAIFDIYEDTAHILWISSYNGLYKTTRPNDYNNIVRVPRECDSCHKSIHILDNKKALLSFNYPHKPKIINHNRINNIPINKNGIVNTIQFTTKEDEQSAPFGKVLMLTNGNIILSLYTHLLIIESDGHFTEKTFDDQILFTYQDKTKGIWIGFRNLGVAYYSNDSLNSEPIWSLKGYSISSITEDNENGIWLSTLEKGIFYTSSKAVIDFSNLSELNKKISSLGIMNNKVFADDFNKTFNVINGIKVVNFILPEVNKSDGIYDYLSLNNKIYIATTSCFLQTDTALNNWKELKYKKFKGHAVIYNMSLSPSQKIYAVNHAVLMTLEGDSINSLDTLPARGRCICATRQGEIYIGCINGLYKYEKHKFIYLGAENKIFSSKINAIKEDSSGNIWVLTMTEGVALYKEGKVISSISIKNSLPSNNCSDIAFGKNGVVWIGTDDGLCKISTTNNFSTDVFNTTHGLISDEITKLVLQNNELWVGTGDGLCMINISLVQTNHVSPPIYITSILVGDSSISLLQTVFPHQSNNFRFQLSGLTFKSNKCHFMYRLIGIDTSWHTSDNFEIPFYNLTPGSYRFEAKALTIDGVASKEAAMFSFTIEKPFWKRWWFILIEILLGSTLIYSLVHYRLGVIHKKEQEKTRINKMIAEYQLTALRTQMNPHFIFNAINSIQHYILKNNTDKAYDYLTKFADLIRMMLNNAQKKTLSLQQELDMLSIYIELEKLRFDEEFEFILTIDEQIETTDRYIPAMLIQPYVENAIWHGLMNLKGKRAGKLMVTIQDELETLKISIQDNGIGRKMAQVLKKRSAHESIGMELNRKRLELLNSLPENKKATVTISDLYDENEEPSGTRVDISLTSEEL
jgi:sensor histidine kinase YesM